jgi:cytochrome d ubiquinol oxidase subunit I
MEFSPVDLSRLQFAITALYHFIFVPLTLGLSLLLAIMESVYVMTGKEIWKKMTQFWGILFGINFAMGVCTGVPLEFQFGTNWSYYSQYVGDVFGPSLAIEGLMAFFLEATFVGLFFFGWNRLSRVGHLIVTWCVAIGANLSALWILVANAWMQYPIGARFNVDTMRMELTSFYEVLFNPVAQSKFVHTVSAGYVTGAMFVLSISAWYLLRGKHIPFAKRSLTVAVSFGLASALSVVVLGDESGYTLSENQKMKLAAIEGMWETEPAPASLTILGIPDPKEQKTLHLIRIPYLLGIIATRSFNTEVLGIKDLVAQAENRVRTGIKAYAALLEVRENASNEEARQTLQAYSADLGHALLLKRYTAKVTDASETQIKQAAQDTVPNIVPLFWTFRIMAGLGFYFILLFALGFYLASVRRAHMHPWFLMLALYSLPLPWIASSFGWIVAEYGRQPWTIDGVLPTFLSGSHVTSMQVGITLAAFILFYTVLLFVGIVLMRKYIRLGPEVALGQK